MLAKFALRTAIVLTITAQTCISVANCSEGEFSCGSSFFSTCCPAEWRCNYRRGIPICQNPRTRYINGFDEEVCSTGNPYLASCDILGVPGFCCPVGMSCHHTDENEGKVYCINPYGVTTAGYPTFTTVTTIPSLTAIPAPAPSGSSNQILFTPSDAWTSVSLEEAELKSSCGGVLNQYRRVTNVLNATITFNYTGPAFMVRTIPSRTGGAFSLIIDGFNTTDFIDTYDPDAASREEAHGEGLNEHCYRVQQFPPMLIVPPGYESRDTHTVSLVYVGAGRSLSGTDPRNLTIQFDSFALPIYSEAQMSPGMRISPINYGILVGNLLFLTAAFLFL